MAVLWSAIEVRSSQEKRRVKGYNHYYYYYYYYYYYCYYYYYYCYYYYYYWSGVECIVRLKTGTRGSLGQQCLKLILWPYQPSSLHSIRMMMMMMINKLILTIKLTDKQDGVATQFPS